MSVTWEPEPEGGVQLGPSPAPEPGLEPSQHQAWPGVNRTKNIKSYSP